jgi:hypothetical protein
MDPFERLLQFRIEAPISVEDFWTLRREMSDKLNEKMAMLSNKQATKVKSEMLEALNEYSTDRGMSFPAEVLIVSGAASLNYERQLAPPQPASVPDKACISLARRRERLRCRAHRGRH